MEEADVKVCAEIYSMGMGYDRGDDIKAMLTKSPERCWVATTEDNTILSASPYNMSVLNFLSIFA